jgi:hypothetical protein
MFVNLPSNTFIHTLKKLMMIDVKCICGFCPANTRAFADAGLASYLDCKPTPQPTQLQKIGR